MTYVLPKSGHVRLHRIWSFASLRDVLTSIEHIHILYCDDCRTTLGVCLQMETFGAVLKKLNREDDTNLSEDDHSRIG